ncbi:hypothetical protein D3C75_1296960 [compost metagenome]
MPGQGLTSRVTGKQPVTGRPQGLADRTAKQRLHTQVQPGLTAQAQLNQRLSLQRQAQPALVFITSKTEPQR